MLKNPVNEPQLVPTCAPCNSVPSHKSVEYGTLTGCRVEGFVPRGMHTGCHVRVFRVSCCERSEVILVDNFLSYQ